MKTAVVACVILCWMQFLPEGEAACLFPTQLQNGTWYSSANGVLLFSTNSTSNSTSIAAYKTQKFGTVALACFVAADDKYVFKSTTTLMLLGLKWEVHFCFKLTSTGFENKYVYHLGSVENTDASNERYKAAIIGTRTPTVASICDRTTYDAGTEHILLKNDGSEVTAAIHFPLAFRGMWKYEFQSAASVNKYCSSNSSSNISSSSMEICRANDTKTMKFDYDKCSTMQAYSAGGLLQAMWTSISSNYTYIHVYNADTTTDEVTTFRFTCYVIDNNATENSTLISATQYPKQCAKTQTPTSVVAPGAFLVFNRTDNCVNLTTTAAPTTVTVPVPVPVVEQSTVISTASAVGVAIGIIILLLILVFAGLLFLYWKKRKEKEADADKLPLSKAHPANIRLKNSEIYRESIRQRNGKPSLMPETKSNGTANGDVKLDIDQDPGIQRENSIHFTINSRGGDGMGPLETPILQPGSVAPVEEPDKLPKPATNTTPSSKYLVDSNGGPSLQRPDKGSSAKAPHSGDRRRFGDVSAESTRTNRKRTPRLRHPMEIQADDEKVKEKEVLKKNQGFWKDERRARSGRRREHPEALTIPSLKEDPFDHKEPTKPTTAPAFSAARGGKSAVSMRLEREKSTFIDPPTDPKTSSEAVFEKASHLWNYKTQTFWG